MSAALAAIQASFQPRSVQLVPPPGDLPSATSSHFPQDVDACLDKTAAMLAVGRLSSCKQQGFQLCNAGQMDAINAPIPLYTVRGQALQPAPESLGQTVLAACGQLQRCNDTSYF